MSTLALLHEDKWSKKEIFITRLRPHVDYLYRLAFKWTGQRQQAETMVEKVLAITAAREEFLGESEALVSTLISRLYKVMSRQRKRKLLNDLTENAAAYAPNWKNTDTIYPRFSSNDNASDVSAVHQSVYSRCVIEMLLALPEDQRVILVLHDGEGFTVSRISKMLSIRTLKVSRQLQQARMQLGDSLRRLELSGLHQPYGEVGRMICAL